MSAALREKVLAKTGGRCFWCEKKLTVSEVTIDHMIPKSKKKGLGFVNQFPACKLCNNDKGNTHPLVYFDLVEKYGPLPNRKMRTPSSEELRLTDLSIRERMRRISRRHG